MLNKQSTTGERTDAQQPLESMEQYWQRRAIDQAKADAQRMADMLFDNGLIGMAEWICMTIDIENSVVVVITEVK